MFWPFKKRICPVCEKQLQQSINNQLISLARGQVSNLSFLVEGQAMFHLDDKGDLKSKVPGSPKILRCINQKAGELKVFLKMGATPTINGKPYDCSFLKDRLNDIPDNWTILLWEGGYSILPPKWSNKFIQEVEV